MNLRTGIGTSSCPPCDKKTNQTHRGGAMFFELRCDSHLLGNISMEWVAITSKLTAFKLSKQGYELSPTGTAQMLRWWVNCIG